MPLTLGLYKTDSIPFRFSRATTPRPALPLDNNQQANGQNIRAAAGASVSTIRGSFLGLVLYGLARRDERVQLELKNGMENGMALVFGGGC